MKMKKLLSIGALGLVLASSISIGASANTIPSNANLIKIIANQYVNGTNATGLLSGVNKDTTNALNDAVTNEIKAENLDKHTVVNYILTNENSTSIANILKGIGKDKIIEIAKKVKAMDDAKNGDERILSENKVIAIVNAYDASLTVTFGKDSNGITTISVQKNLRPLIQLNSDNLQALIDTLDSINSISEIS